MEYVQRNLYIHFPYCETKCHYCDFFSLPENKFSSDSRFNVYSSILSELGLFQENLPPFFETVFLGGGTPSLVPFAILEELFLDKIKISPSSEVTIESNPSSVTLEKVKFWKETGVNRMSLGIQALNDERLEWLGRVHSKESAFRALETATQAGIPKISTDYIVGVPGQTPSLIEKELTELFNRFPQISHISVYLLTLQKQNSKFKQLLPEQDQLEHLRTVSSFLKSYGFEQYEISNFAKPGFRARHNENYWLGGGYLGIGPSAHSYWPDKSLRTKNWASLGKYTELVSKGQRPIEWDETITAKQQRLEFLMLRLRRLEGLNLSEFQALYNEDLSRSQAAWIEAFEQKGLCKLESTASGLILKLTSEGFFLSDQILRQIA